MKQQFDTPAVKDNSYLLSNSLSWPTHISWTFSTNLEVNKKLFWLQCCFSLLEGLGSEKLNSRVNMEYLSKDKLFYQKSRVLASDISEVQCGPCFWKDFTSDVLWIAWSRSSKSWRLLDQHLSRILAYKSAWHTSAPNTDPSVHEITSLNMHMELNAKEGHVIFIAPSSWVILHLLLWVLCSELIHQAWLGCQEHIDLYLTL